MRRYSFERRIARGALARAISPIASRRLTVLDAADRALIQAQPNNPYFYELKGRPILEVCAAKPNSIHRCAAP